MSILNLKYRLPTCQISRLTLLKNLRFLVVPSAVLACTGTTVAQISPDNTLGTENSSILPNAGTINGQPTDLVGGGARRGNNLFHSFSKFNVANGQQVYFNNPAGIARIISRVTGNQRSSILGTLGVQGNADLFFMNPNGLLFGPRSKLDVNGSFLGTTANSLIFDRNIKFSANDPQAPPQLAINVPLGLQFNHQPADIVVQGSGHQLISPNPLFAFSERTGSREFDLTVKPTKTLALVGGKINLDGSILTTPDGSIQLGGVRSGFVGINSTPVGLAFDYQNVQNFGDITLFRQTLLDSSGTSIGSIQVQGRRVSLNDGSVIRIQNLGNQTGRSLVIDASDSLQLIGTNPSANIRSSLTATALASGRGSDILVSTRKLTLQEGGVISAGTIGSGLGGTLRINASEFVDVLGTSPLDSSVISLLSTGAFGSGNAGDAFVSTKRLRVTSGGLVTSATLASGHGGDLTVNASDSIELVGVGPEVFANSAVSASSLNSGDAGSLVINTKRLMIKEGARVDASTFASGTAGSVTINATDSIEVSGVAPGGRDSSFIISSANLLSQELRTTFDLPPTPTGEAGSVTIKTKDLRVTDGAFVSVKNDGPGDAGTLRINADNIFLGNKAGITASTISGNGGDIDLHISNLLLMRNSSVVSAAAQGSGDGGNIDIAADLILAFPTENSDIIANAFSGRGGKISITTQGLFGLEVRNQPTKLSDITAISQNDPTLNGIVNINNPEVDPSDSLTDLPETIDVPQSIAQGCRAGQSLGNSRFVHLGRGGLPPGPSEPQTAAALWQDLREPGNRPTQAQSLPARPNTIDRQVDQKIAATPPVRSKINEARGWIRDDQGRMVLTANLPDQPWQSQRQPSAEC